MNFANPSTNGSNGRNALGRFTPGNRFSKGNPTATLAARLRVELLKQLAAGDNLARIVRHLLARAESGDFLAAREILDRTICNENMQALKRDINRLGSQLSVLAGRIDNIEDELKKLRGLL